jgi:hypothetical protein
VAGNCQGVGGINLVPTPGGTNLVQGWGKSGSHPPGEINVVPIMFYVFSFFIYFRVFPTEDEK